MSKTKRSAGSYAYLKRRFPDKMKKKLVMSFIFAVAVFAVMIVRIITIDAKDGEKYGRIVLDQQQRAERVIPYKRGDISDRNGTVIATSERVYNVILDPKVLLEPEDGKIEQENIAKAKEALLKAFGIKESAVDDVIKEKPDSRHSILKKYVTYKEAQAFEKKYPNLTGVWLERDYLRTYPYATLASDVLGYTVSGNLGNAGIEFTYNDILNGTDGREYRYQTAQGSAEKVIHEAVNGKNVVSTIDISLQSIVEKHILAFNEAHKNEAREGAGSKNTAVIIADPNNGEILAEASYPNYDPNKPRDLSGYYTQEEIDGMDDDAKLAALNDIWRNFCVSEIYEPGSTAKPFTVAAGLESGKVKGNEVYNCSGSLNVGGWSISCHKRDGHGNQTISDAVANSCNVSMMKMIAQTGVDEFCKYQSIFGFGEKTGIDLPGEESGLIYDPGDMDDASLATNSFGQNFNVTMTQMIAAYSSLINGGKYYKPHVIKQVTDEDGNVIKNVEPLLLKKTVSEGTSEQLREYMKQVMITGTGKNAQVPGYSIGAKTGTAEKQPRGQGNYLISYMGFAPADKPRVLIYVVIDEPNTVSQDNSALVTDLSREIMAEVFSYMDIPRDESAPQP